MAALSRRATLVGGLWSVAAMVFPLVSTLLLSVVIARRLGSSELGEQSLISYVGSLIGGVVVIAATNCATQLMSAARGRGDIGRVAALTRLSARAHLVGGLCAGVGIAGVGALRGHSLAWVFIGLVVFIDALGWSHGSRLVAEHGWRAVSPLRLVSQFAGSLLGVAAVLLGGGVAGVFAAQVLSSAWLAFVLRRRDLRNRTAVTVPPVALPLRPLVGSWLMFVAAMLLSQIVDKRVELLFLDAYSSVHVVAVYAVGFSLVSVAVTIPSALLGATIPGIAAVGASDGELELSNHLRQAARLAVLTGFLFTAALASVGPAVVRTFWGDSLQDAATILPWMSLSVLFVPLRSLYTAYWTGVGRLGSVLWTGAGGAVVDVLLAFLLVPRLGLAGAVIANVAAQLTACALITRHTRRQSGDLGVPLPYVARVAAIALTVGGASWAATAATAAGAGGLGAPIALLAGAVTCVAAAGLIGAAVGLVPRDDADWVAGALPAGLRPALVLVGGVRWSQSRSALLAAG